MELRDQNGLTQEEFLRQYNPEKYNRPSLAADMVIFTVLDQPEENYRKLPEKKLCLLLVKRGAHPYLGDWALPGGFVREDESAGQAARRELREETGLEQVYLEQLRTFTEPHRDPRAWVVSCAHMALVDASRLHLQAGDDAAEAAWFQLTREFVSETTETSSDGCVVTQQYRLALRAGDIRLSCTLERSVAHTAQAAHWEYHILDNGGLAFDHPKIIACALDRLQGKLEYTDLALHLMPQRFTISQLQQVYQVILGKSLLPAAFRRKIAPLVTGTDQYLGQAGHRPSQLFQRNWEGISRLM